MIEIKTGDIVLIDSPIFPDAFAFGRVYGKPTEATVMLQGMEWDLEDWHPKPKRHSRLCVRAVLPQDTDLKALRARISERRKIMTAEVESARKRYHDAVIVMAGLTHMQGVTN